jgi:NADPH2:quinone reductase
MKAVAYRVWYAGDFTGPGSNAELQCVDERIVARMPQSLSFVQAAALPLTAITAWELLFDRLEVTAQTKGTLLIVGAAGRVCSILTQRAHAFIESGMARGKVALEGF